jgi:hypothetical protein
MIWVSLAFLGVTIVVIRWMKRDPAALDAWLQTASSASLWLNDVEGDVIAVMPQSVPWSAFLLVLFPNTFSTFLAVISTGLTACFLPAYERYHASLPRYFTKTFLEETKPEADRLKNPLGLYVRVFMGCLLLLLVALPREESSALPLCLLGLLGACALCTAYLNRARRRFLREELRKRFDVERLVSAQRRTRWRIALRVWIVFPIAIIAVAFTVPFYVFDEHGIREYRYGAQTVIPWHSVTSFDVGFSESMSPQNGSRMKDRKKAKPRLDIAFTTPEGKIDLNSWGGLTGVPRLVHRIHEIVRMKNVSIECTSQPKAEEQLKAYLNDPSEEAGAKDTFGLIHQICSPQG